MRSRGSASVSRRFRLNEETPPPGSAGFDRPLRLRKPEQFKHVALGGNRLSRPAVAVSYRSNDGTTARLGLAIAKKSVPHATDRNRIKRLIRDDFRRHRQQLPNVDLVFHARPGLAALSNASLRDVLAQLRAQLIDRCRRSSSPARSAPTSAS